MIRNIEEFKDTLITMKDLSDEIVQYVLSQKLDKGKFKEIKDELEKYNRNQFNVHRLACDLLRMQNRQD